jgi:hypothetical protein
MPVVNGICNTKMSLCAGNLVLLLRHDAALRNIPNIPAKRHGACAAMGK